MGFYIRKSLSVGPFRFNLSKSGIGVSAGIKGFRVGSGPHGNYVHMGRGGFYFRKTLSPGHPSSSQPTESEDESEFPPPVSDEEPLKEIESGSVLSMTDSSARELLEELNSKRALFRFFPISAIASILFFSFVAFSGAPVWLLVVVGVLGMGLSAAARLKDQLRKTAVIFYSFEPDVERAYQRLHDAFDALSECSKTWHIQGEGAVKDRKYHAGASTLIERKRMRLSTGGVPFVKTNIELPTIPLGRQLLAFMPERLLVFSPEGVGAVAYSELQIGVTPTRFIESERVASDSRIVDHTWMYVNKDGGPDRRFKENRELPVVLYEEIYFSSDSGLNELIQVSRTGLGEHFKATVAALAALKQIKRPHVKDIPAVIHFRCQSCGVKLKAKANAVGKNIDCPKCGKEFCIPSACGLQAH
jgi:hypothetical protein